MFSFQGAMPKFWSSLLLQKPAMTTSTKLKRAQEAVNSSALFMLMTFDNIVFFLMCIFPEYLWSGESSSCY